MAQYHISYKELLWGESWAFYQRGMIDAPQYESNNTDSDGIIKVDDLDSEKQILSMLKPK